MSITPNSAGAFLTINLRQIAENWKEAQKRVSPAFTGAVLKTNAYGLGSKKIASALYKAGCRHFFTAYIHEAIDIRSVAPDAEIYTLHGIFPRTELDFFNGEITPVLATLEQVEYWNHLGDKENKKYACALHLDTGMTRLGLTQENIDFIISHSNQFSHLDVRLVISHLACGDELQNPKSEKQLALFKQKVAQLRKIFGQFKCSLSATDGSRLENNEFYCDLIRYGVGLYDHAISLDAKILQIQTAHPGQTVGYGATYKIEKETKIATLAIGYGDGYPRTLGNKGFVYIAGYKCPIIGKISMDLTTVDVSEIPEDILKTTPTAEIFGEHLSIFDVAKSAGTIHYELLTNLSNRYYRIYEGDEEV
ncbi:MAG: alanine racemase [Alphaproteobacteria bacterium]|nr:alanine racemase [Alphaproteobacteria bacterium]